MSVEEQHAGVNRLDLFVAPMGDSAFRHASLLAHDLRRNGTSVEVAAEGKLKKHLELANKIGARYALIIGDNEIAAGEYALKDLTSGEQRQVSREQLFQTFEQKN
jgi:histidyl-tRNA synthetase